MRYIQAYAVLSLSFLVLLCILIARKCQQIFQYRHIYILEMFFPKNDIVFIKVSIENFILVDKESVQTPFFPIQAPGY